MDEMERGKEGKDVAKRRREQGGGQVSRVEMRKERMCQGR